MAEQPELDLQLEPTPAPAREARRSWFAGFSKLQILVGLIGLLLAVWGMWVTKTLLTPAEDHLVSARLSSLVGEYVEAQRFSGSPPERVKAEMQAFMGSLDKELQRRGSGGQVVLVGEAVLTKNVPDITESLKKAVFASGIPEPKRASLEQLQQLQSMAAAAAQRSPAAPSTPDAALIDPMTGVPSAQPQMAVPTMQPAPSAAPAGVGPAGASVSTFGGPGGDGGQ